MSVLCESTNGRIGRFKSEGGMCVEEQDRSNSCVRFRLRQRGESWMLIEYDGPSQVMDERRGPEQ